MRQVHQGLTRPSQMLEQWGLWYQQGDSGLAQKVRLQFGIVGVWLKLSSGIGRINIEEI
jgi:hypothetical protein